MSCVVWMWLSGWGKHSVNIKYFMTSLTWSVANFDIWRSLKTVCHVSRGLSSASNSIPFLKHLYFRFEWVEFVFLSTLLFYYFMLNCRAWVLLGEVSAVILGSQSSCAYPRLSLLPNSLQNYLRRGWHSHYIFLLTLSDSLLTPSLQVNNYYVYIILYGVSLPCYILPYLTCYIKIII